MKNKIIFSCKFLPSSKDTSLFVFKSFLLVIILIIISFKLIFVKSLNQSDKWLNEFWFVISYTNKIISASHVNIGIKDLNFSCPAVSFNNKWISWFSIWIVLIWKFKPIVVW